MADSPGALFESLLSIMSRLRGEGGCPWDREQTHESLKPYLIEEAYEVLDAIDSGARAGLVEELGDLLFQVVFHSQVASEQSEFSMRDVLTQLCDKMIRRHPHVFAGAPVADARAALAQWEQIKQDEGKADGGRRSALDGVPRALPALLRAQRLQAKAARVGFDWTEWPPAWAKVREEVAELDESVAAGDAGRIREELGDLLFSIVNVARLLGMDAEDALRQADEKFTRRFMEVEAEMRAEGRAMADASARDLDESWERAKARESKGQGVETPGRPMSGDPR
jgi:MazG family protein